MIRFLSEALVIRMHDYVISKYGGAYGVLDAAALDSALNAPKLQFHFLHSPVPHLAATYGFHLCKITHFLREINVLLIWQCSHFLGATVSSLSARSTITIMSC